MGVQAEEGVDADNADTLSTAKYLQHQRSLGDGELAETSGLRRRKLPPVLYSVAVLCVRYLLKKYRATTALVS